MNRPFSIRNQIKQTLIVLLCLLMTAAWSSPAQVNAAGGVVRSVFFYSPSCASCKEVTVGILPSLKAVYGAQFEISMLDVSSPKGQPVWAGLVEKYKLSADLKTQPVILVGQTALVGADDIRSRFSGLIDVGIQSGGVNWPDLPGLKEALAEDTTQFGANSSGEISWNDAFANYLAIFILLIMVGSFIWQGKRCRWLRMKISQINNTSVPKLARLVPILVLIGLVISLYLSYVELTASEAVCGPVGNCNAVQTSPYARLFGFFPVGVLGTLGNLSILGAWWFKYFGPTKLRIWATKILVGLVCFGILFSIYLTYLEPFVIRATCAWCLGSAAVMTTLFWIVFETTWDKKDKRARRARHS